MVSTTSTASPEAFFNIANSRESFPSPWFDIASSSMPTNIKDALKWTEFIWWNNGTYRMAMERVIAYFLTEVEFGAADSRDMLGDDEQEKYKNYFDEVLGISSVIQNMDRDKMAYGNAFSSMMVPFRRLLACPKCGAQFPLEVVAENPTFKFKFNSNFDFIATCPQCKVGRGYRGAFNVSDLPDDLESKLRVKIWPCHEMEIRHDLYSGENQYIWKIPEDYRRNVRKGDVFTLSRAPLPVLEAVQKDQLFKFDDGVIYHMKEPTLGGQRNRGWGLSRVLTNYRDLWHVQVLRRYNEAIALDYIIPFRVLTPDSRPGGGGMSKGASTDPLLTFDTSDFRGQVMNMVRKRRKDPASWNFLPFPIKYQALGGEAKDLAPHELVGQGYDTLLNASGVPAELYRGTLQLQSAPVALRLFEATWHHLVCDNNDFLRWVVEQTSQILAWEVIKATMRRVTYADDFNKQLAQLQLMMGQAVSSTTGLKAIGLDWKDEQRRLSEEARFQSELQANMEEEMAQAAFGEQIAKGQPAMPGGMPAGGGMGAGMPAGGGMPAEGGMGAGPGEMGMGGMSPVNQLLQGFGENTPITPVDMLGAAESLAAQLLTLPETQRRSELILLKQKNVVLHDLVRAQMDEKRSRARSAGQAMMLGQQPSQPAM